MKLVDNLFLTYRLGNIGISLDMDIEEKISFDMDTSVPLDITINELVSNSLKHAFSCRDNGLGIPEEIDIENLESFGLQLVTTLGEQLDGELELKRDNGTEFIMRFTVTEK